MYEDSYLDGDDDIGSCELMEVLWETREWDDVIPDEDR